MLAGGGAGGRRGGLQGLSPEEQPGCAALGCAGGSRESTGPLELS